MGLIVQRTRIHAVHIHSDVDILARISYTHGTRACTRPRARDTNRNFAGDRNGVKRGAGEIGCRTEPVKASPLFRRNRIRQSFLGVIILLARRDAANTVPGTGTHSPAEGAPGSSRLDSSSRGSYFFHPPLLLFNAVGWTRAISREWQTNSSVQVPISEITLLEKKKRETKDGGREN